MVFSIISAAWAVAGQGSTRVWCNGAPTPARTCTHWRLDIRILTWIVSYVNPARNLKRRLRLRGSGGPARSDPPGPAGRAGRSPAAWPGRSCRATAMIIVM